MYDLQLLQKLRCSCVAPCASYILMQDLDNVCKEKITSYGLKVLHQYTRRKIMPKMRLELATPGLQTQCSSHCAIQLKSYCWEGVEFNEEKLY